MAVYLLEMTGFAPVVKRYLEIAFAVFCFVLLAI